MIKPEQIPESVRMAFEQAHFYGGNSVKESLAEAINAWPGAVLKISLSWPENFIDLPIPKEKNDD